jgi:hypothetical protein
MFEALRGQDEIDLDREMEMMSTSLVGKRVRTTRVNTEDER